MSIAFSINRIPQWTQIIKFIGELGVNFTKLLYTHRRHDISILFFKLRDVLLKINNDVILAHFLQTYNIRFSL